MAAAAPAHSNGRQHRPENTPKRPPTLQAPDRNRPTRQYERNDNVNNASSARELRLGSRVWVRDEASLPQKATGLRYSAALDRAVNIGGNHFLTGGVGLDGVFYWDRREYNEENLRVTYRHLNINSNIPELYQRRSRQWFIEVERRF